MKLFSRIAKFFVQRSIVDRKMTPVGKDLFWLTFIATLSNPPRRFWISEVGKSIGGFFKKTPLKEKKALGRELQTLVTFGWRDEALTNNLINAISTINDRLETNIWPSIIWGYVWMIRRWSLLFKRKNIRDLAPKMMAQAKKFLPNYMEVKADLNFIANYNYSKTRNKEWKRAYKRIQHALRTTRTIRKAKRKAA